MKNIKYLWKYSGKYKFAMILLPIVVAVGAFFEILIPYQMSQIMDIGIANSDMSYIVRESIGMVIASILMVGCAFIRSFLLARWGVGLSCNLKNALFERILELPSRDAEEIGVASALTRMSTDINYITKALLMFCSLINAPIHIVITIIMTSRVAAKVTPFFIISAVAFCIVIGIITKIALKHYRKMFIRYDDMNGILEENLVGMKTIKAFSASSHECNQFEISSEALKKEKTIAERLTVLMDPLLHLVIDVCILLLVLFGSDWIISGQMQAGDLFCVITYANQILFQIYMIALIMVPILTAMISMDRVFEVINRTPSFEFKGSVNQVPSSGNVTLSNVNFGYFPGEDKRVLKNINLDIRPGEFLGIIGPSGSGKTTLLNLIAGLYKSDTGSIRIDGNEITDYTEEKLRLAYGLVPQKSLLFSGTVKDNVQWGKEDATNEEIVQACCTAAANDFIMGMKDGYGTMLEQGGINVSGGQRQRICIARAIVRKPKLLLMDDSLSAVDNRTESSIIDALLQRDPSETLILVSQKISSVRKADRIIVLNHGEIDGIGTNEELLQSNTVYQEFYESQRKVME